jgi:nicotinamidase-related amidase
MTRALLIIDVQQDYFAGGALPLHRADDVETAILAAITHAKRAGDRIVLVRHVSDAQTGLFAETGSGIAVRPAVLAAACDAPIVTKRFADAFQETNLDERLDGVTELLVCGMMTQNCVVFTAMSEAARRFDVSVIDDLCAAPTEIVHLIALSALRSKLRVTKAVNIWS